MLTAMQDGQCILLRPECKFSVCESSGRLPCCITSALCVCANRPSHFSLLLVVWRTMRDWSHLATCEASVGGSGPLILRSFSFLWLWTSSQLLRALSVRTASGFLLEAKILFHTIYLCGVEFIWLYLVVHDRETFCMLYTCMHHARTVNINTGTNF